MGRRKYPTADARYFGKTDGLRTGSSSRETGVPSFNNEGPLGSFPTKRRNVRSSAPWPLTSCRRIFAPRTSTKKRKKKEAKKKRTILLERGNEGTFLRVPPVASFHEQVPRAGLTVTYSNVIRITEEGIEHSRAKFSVQVSRGRTYLYYRQR